MPLMTMRAVAERLSLHYDTFRKSWTELPGFPAPVLGRRWSPEAIEAWIEARTARPIRMAVSGPAHSLPADRPPARPDEHLARSATRARQQLEALRRQG